VLGLVGVGGAGLLWWMGLGLLKSSRHSHLKFDSQGDSDLNPVMAGVLMSAANPYWLIWWLTIGLGYVMFSMQYGWLGVALFFIGHILADFAWYTLVSGAVAQGRRFISDRVYQGFLAGCGVFLFGFGGYFAVQGVKFLLNS
jgi:threonine/homoserine/homoserine lactone efflux protein